MSKGEIARFEQFLLMSLCFQKVVYCRGVRKRLYEGKGKLKCVIGDPCVFKFVPFINNEHYPNNPKG